MNFRSIRFFHDEVIFSAVLVIFALLLRLPTIGRPLAGDEAISFNRYSPLPWKQILFVYSETNQHSLFSVMSNLCLQFLSESEWAFRLPSLLAGVLAIPLLYYLSHALGYSRSASCIASCLLAISEPHLSYSQIGRGYAPTVFFSLILSLAAVNLVQRKNRIMWGIFLSGSGIALVLTLPSNVFFLAACGIYCLATTWLGYRDDDRSFFDKSFSLLVFFVLFLLAVAYFYIIYPELLAAKKNYAYATLSFSLFSNVARFLAAPWGLWLYFIVAVGLSGLKTKNEITLFASIFAIPVILMFVTATGGFSRIYIYFLPFTLLLTALGIEKIITFVFRMASPLLAYGVIALIAIGITIQPAEFLAKYYPANSRNYETASSMANAREAAAYIRANIPRDYFVALLVSPEGAVVNRYLDHWLRESMFGFFYGGRLDKVVIVNVGDPIYPVYYNDDFPGLPRESLRLIKSFGNLQIHLLDKNVSRFIPSTDDPDYETRLNLSGSNQFTVEYDSAQRVRGDGSLVLRKTEQANLFAISPTVNMVDIKKEGAYVLTIYARKYGQKSKAFLAEYSVEKRPPSIAYLNPYFGEFAVSGLSFDWQMVFLLAPISMGRHGFTEAFHLHDNVSYFDGFQSYILY